MKTQISHLRSGTRNQILNPQIDYSKLPAASSHIGHSGSNSKKVKQFWDKVTQENPEILKIRIKGIKMVLTAYYSTSRKSVHYAGSVTKKDLEEKFFLKAAKNETPSVSIHLSNVIIVSNGKNDSKYICPSLIEIL